MRPKTFLLLALLAIVPAGAGCSPIAPDKPKVIPCDSAYGKSSEANIRSCTAELAKPGLTEIDRAVLHGVRANNYFDLKQYDRAIADYSETIRLSHVNLDYAFANRGLAKCASGDCKAALADYDAALRVDPKNSYARYGRGVARLRSGDSIGGNADILQARSEDPDVERLYRQIGMTP